MKQVDVVVIGAGAAGLMCAAQAGYRGRSVLLLDNAKKPGRKILISGGGRCNFTNHQAGPHAFLSGNPHFCKSALARYTQQDFIDLVDRHGVNYHEKTLGQLFCDESAKEIVEVLLTECDWAGVTLQCQTEILSVSKTDDGFLLDTSKGEIAANLHQLYSYSVLRLTQGNLRNDSAAVAQVVELIEPLAAEQQPRQPRHQQGVHTKELHRVNRPQQPDLAQEKEAQIADAHLHVQGSQVAPER